MTNEMAAWLFACLFAGAIAVGQAMHLAESPVWQQRAAAFVDALRAARHVWFNTAGGLEWTKNILQAVLLSGGGMVGFLVANPSNGLTTAATGVGFVVDAFLMWLVTHRLEALRDAQAAEQSKRNTVACGLQKD